MNKYRSIIDSLERMKYKTPKDEVDRIFNIAIDAAIQRVYLVRETEKALENLQEVVNG